MPKEEIVFRMFPDGKRELEVNGVVGKACDKATAKMAKSLGKVTKQTRKPCYHQKQAEGQKEIQF